MSVEAQFVPYCDKVVEFHQYRQLEGLSAAEARTQSDTFWAFCEAAQMVADIPELGMAYRGVLNAQGKTRQSAIDTVRSIELGIAEGLLDAEVIGDEAYTRRRTELQKPAEVIRHAKGFERLFSTVLPPKPKSSISRVKRAVNRVLAPTPPVSDEPVVETVKAYDLPVPEPTEQEASQDTPAEVLPLSFLPEPAEPFVPEPTKLSVVPEVIVSTQLEVNDDLSEEEMFAVFAHNLLQGIRDLEHDGQGIREVYLRQKLKRYVDLDSYDIDCIFEDFQETGQLSILHDDHLDGTFWTTKIATEPEEDLAV